jgi:ATP-binding cassette subfamily B protein
MATIRRILQFLRPYAKEVILASIMMVLVVIADLSIPTLVKIIIDDGIYAGDMSTILRTSLIMVSATIISAVLAIGNSVFSIRASQGLATDLRDAIYTKIQSYSFGNLDDFQTGQLLTRLTSDVNQVQTLVQMSLRILTRAPIMLVGSLILMFYLDSRLAMNMLVILPVTLVVMILAIRYIQPLFKMVQNKLDNLNQVLQENLSGIRVVKAFVRGDYENKRFRTVNEEYTGLNVKTSQVISILIPVMFLIINLAGVAIVYFGGIQAVNGVGSVGVIMAFLNYLLSFSFPLLMLAMVAGFISMSYASAQRIEQVLESEQEIKEVDDPVTLKEFRGRIAFENVSFMYNGNSGEPVLQNINLVVEPGEVVALLGATGSGKTSLVNLIPRFYDATEGRVTIDGVDVRALDLEFLRSLVGISLQEAVLFSGTIMDNIKYGRKNATDTEVVTAAKAAQAHEFIIEFPNGYETVIGQRGVNLSGGQKQRVAIARALLVRPKILILDDSTSAVDVETEAKIHDALNQIMKNRTSFIIAQRISTVLTADKIILLDDGRISAMGNHQQMMEISPLYREIFDSQLGNGGVNTE